MYVTSFYVRKAGETQWTEAKPCATNTIFRNAKARVRRWVKGRKDDESREAIVHAYEEYERGQGELVHVATELNLP
jgi:hypothetical protein